jgi:hypothetical protein
MSSAATLVLCCAILCTLPRLGHAEPPSGDEPPAAPASDEVSGDVIEYANGQLTVDVVEMPLQTVLREVGKQTGARIQAQDLESTKVTDEFTALPLDAAIRRLVAGRNFTLIYTSEPGADGKQAGRRLKEVQVFGEPAVGRGPAAPAAAPKSARVRPAAGGKPEARAGTAPTPGTERAAAKPARQATPGAVQAPGDAQEESAETPPKPPPLANPVGATIAGDALEAEAAPEPAPAPEQEPEEESWVQGHEGEVPAYDEGFGAEAEAYDEGFEEDAYGGEVEGGEVEPFEER